jgi:hypothetical protein
MLDKEKSKEQIAIAERIQMKLLERWEKLLNSDEITAAEVAVVTKMLRDSGWTLDPAQLPQGVRDKLTAKIDPTQWADDDADVVGKIA